VSRVLVSVWVLDVAQIIVLEVVVAGVAIAVDVIDGTDGAVVSDDVAGNGDGDGLVAVVWVLESTRSVVSAFFIKVGLLLFAGSV
jgi:hypothetical protein